MIILSEHQLFIIGMLTLVFGVVFVIILLGNLFYMFLEYLDKKQGNFNKEIDSRKLLLPMLRTVKRILIHMSKKAGLLAWCDLDTCFHPIAIPVKEMCHLKYEIRTREVTLTPNEYYEVPFEITVTSPESAEIEKQPIWKHNIKRRE